MSTLGFGLVRLRDLVHDNDELSKSHSYMEANVRRLERAFRLEGCNRFEKENWVQVAIERSSWDQIASKHGLQSQQDCPKAESDWTLLDVHRPLQILHGRHRLVAAERFFRYSTRKEWFWTVEFLDTTGMS